MPPKGWSAGREDTEVKAVRIPASMIERIGNHVERLQAQFRFGRVNEGMAIRDLLEVGLDTVEAATPPPHHAVPLAPESVPLPALLPATETPPAPAPMAPVGMKPCSKGHVPYPMGKNECPTCAAERMRASRKRKAEEKAGAQP
jgi:hypothetical protein